MLGNLHACWETCMQPPRASLLVTSWRVSEVIQLWAWHSWIFKSTGAEPTDKEGPLYLHPLLDRRANRMSQEANALLPRHSPDLGSLLHVECQVAISCLADRWRGSKRWSLGSLRQSHLCPPASPSVALPAASSKIHSKSLSHRCRCLDGAMEFAVLHANGVPGCLFLMCSGKRCFGNSSAGQCNPRAISADWACTPHAALRLIAVLCRGTAAALQL